MVNIVRKNCVIFVREGETTNECYSWFWIFHARSKWRRAKARRIKMEKLFECDDAPPSYESLESIQSSFPKNNISIKERHCRSFLKLTRYEDFLFSLTPQMLSFLFTFSIKMWSPKTDRVVVLLVILMGIALCVFVWWCWREDVWAFVKYSIFL